MARIDGIEIPRPFTTDELPDSEVGRDYTTYLNFNKSRDPNFIPMTPEKFADNMRKVNGPRKMFIDQWVAEHPGFGYNEWESAFERVGNELKKNLE